MRKKLISEFFKFVILLIIGILLLCITYLSGMKVHICYMALCVVISILYSTIYLISPRNLIIAYYILFFVIPPFFAELHFTDDFSEVEYFYIFSMVYITQLTGLYGSICGEISVNTAKKYKTSNFSTKIKYNWIVSIIIFLFVISTLLILHIVSITGGFEKWISEPGQAFLNRAGSGVFVILSHFTTFILSSLVGFYTYKTRRYILMTVFLVWLVLTSPVHGSKGLIFIFISLLFLPWLKNVKLLSAKTLAIVIIFIVVFLYGLYLRNLSWVTLDSFIPYSLNYFTALSNFRLMFNDFAPGLLQTFFLPFNKFKTPFGLSDKSLYYDMNHMLSDIYFPESWEIRATEQWPVEVDLYLNFYFLFGLFLPFIYTFIIGFFYKKSMIVQNLGYWVVSYLLILNIVSHFRGSIYNHVDFYNYPMYIVIFLILRRFKF